MLELSDTNVLDSVKTGKFILMFYTNWCPFCPPIIATLWGLEQEEIGKIQFAKINYDNNPQAVVVFSIIGVPTVLAVKDGAVLQGWVGLTDTNACRAIVNDMRHM